MSVMMGKGASGRATRFAPWHRWDRNAFAGLTAYAWIGILWGFGGDIANHIAQHRPAFPPIVHVHALAFVSWLALFTVQIGLIRTNRIRLHRKLGYAMIALGLFMLVIGPATALHVDKAGLNTPGSDPTFVFIQLADMVGFLCLAGAGIALRKHASAHKRLMMLSLLFIVDAGFARFLFPMFGKMAGTGILGNFLVTYAGNDLGMVALGAYDLVTRRRLHPAYLVGVAVVLLLQLGAIFMYLDAHDFRPLALQLIRLG